MVDKEVNNMSPEITEYLADYARQETAKAAAMKTDNRYFSKREQFNPRGDGTSRNKEISKTRVWRK